MPDKYGKILGTKKWGAILYQKEYQTNGMHQNLNKRSTVLCNVLLSSDEKADKYTSLKEDIAAFYHENKGQHGYL